MSKESDNRFVEDIETFKVLYEFNPSVEVVNFVTVLKLLNPSYGIKSLIASLKFLNRDCKTTYSRGVYAYCAMLDDNATRAIVIEVLQNLMNEVIRQNSE